VATHFTRAAAAYADYVAPAFAAAHDYVVTYAHERGARRVADVACGDGRVAARLAELGATVVAVDESEPLLSRARSLSEDVTWIEADAHRLPLESRTFDLVLCVLGLQLFAEPAQALAELERLVAPDGELLTVFLLDAAAGEVDAGRVAAARQWVDALVAGRPLAPAGRALVKSSVTLTGPEALAAVLSGEVGPWSEARVAPETLAEAAPFMLERAGGAIELALEFEAVHTVPRAGRNGTSNTIPQPCSFTG
jgi:SAM-dependent methyltransferase